MKPWSSFFLHQNLNLTFTLKKKSANLYYGVHRLIVEWFKLGSCWQQEVLTTSLLLHVIYFCHFYSLLFHYEYENCQLAKNIGILLLAEVLLQLFKKTLIFMLRVWFVHLRHRSYEVQKFFCAIKYDTHELTWVYVHCFYQF